MKFLSYVLCVILLSLLILGSSGCCGGCDKGFVGDFGLEADSPQWMNFDQATTRVFRNQDNDQLVLTYTEAESGFRSASDECEEEGNCGLCCFTYNVGYLFRELSGSSINSGFLISIEKNFLTNSITDPISNFDDVLTISVGNRFSKSLVGVPDTTINRSVTLNGTSFSGVFVYEDDVTSYPETTPGNTPTSFYFTKTQGIVAFHTYDEDLWVLKL